MFVKTGFTLDYGKVKFDVGLDETDLGRILAENGLPPDARLTSLEAFQLLRISAEMLNQRQLARAMPGKAEECGREFKSLGAQLADQLGKITGRLDMRPEGG